MRATHQHAGQYPKTGSQRLNASQDITLTNALLSASQRQHSTCAVHLQPDLDATSFVRWSPETMICKSTKFSQAANVCQRHRRCCLARASARALTSSTVDCTCTAASSHADSRSSHELAVRCRRVLACPPVLMFRMPLALRAAAGKVAED